MGESATATAQDSIVIKPGPSAEQATIEYTADIRLKARARAAAACALRGDARRMRCHTRLRASAVSRAAAGLALVLHVSRRGRHPRAWVRRAARAIAAKIAADGGGGGGGLWAARRVDARLGVERAFAEGRHKQK